MSLLSESSTDRRLFESPWGVHVLCLQEVHGYDSEVLSTFSGWLPGWRFWFSGCQSAEGMFLNNKGGVLIGICPQLYAQADNFEHAVFVPGRLHGVCGNFGAFQLRILNVHNADVGRKYQSFVRCWINAFLMIAPGLCTDALC